MKKFRPRSGTGLKVYYVFTLSLTPAPLRGTPFPRSPFRLPREMAQNDRHSPRLYQSASKISARVFYLRDAHAICLAGCRFGVYRASRFYRQTRGLVHARPSSYARTDQWPSECRHDCIVCRTESSFAPNRVSRRAGLHSPTRPASFARGERNLVRDLLIIERVLKAAVAILCRGFVDGSVYLLLGGSTRCYPFWSRDVFGNRWTSKGRC